MATTKASGRIVFHQIADGTTVSFSLSANMSTKQSHYKDNNSFYPDYTKNKLVIKPILTGPGTGSTNLVKGTCTWKMDGTAITSGQGGYTIATSGDYSLTIAANLSGTGHILSCEYDYKPDAVHQSVHLRAEIPLNRDEVAGSAITASIKNSSGGTHFATNAGGEVFLSFEGQMVRGGVEDTTDVEYHWFITGNGGKYYEITSATAPSGSGLPSGNLFVLGTNKKTIQVSSNAVLNVASLKLMVKDTDSNSGTTGMTAEDVIGLVDDTDPFQLRFDYKSGDGMNTSGTTSTYPVVVSIWQGTSAWSVDSYNGKTLSFYRETAAGGKDANFNPAGDFAGWTVDTTNHEVKRTFASATDGTDANRTLQFKPSHLISTQAETSFIVSLIF